MAILKGNQGDPAGSFDNPLPYPSETWRILRESMKILENPLESPDEALTSCLLVSSSNRATLR